MLINKYEDNGYIIGAQVHKGQEHNRGKIELIIDNWQIQNRIQRDSYLGWYFSTCELVNMRTCEHPTPILNLLIRTLGI